MEQIERASPSVRERMIQGLISPRLWVVWSALLVVFLYFPSHPSTLDADDFLIRSQVAGSADLALRGMMLADPARPLLSRLADTFHFYSDEKGTNAIYRAYGNLPWWSSEHALMSPFRPVAAFTHWLDFSVFDADPWRMGVLKLACLMLLWVGSLSLFKKLTDSTLLACLMALLVVVDFSVFINFKWLAARNSYLAVGVGALSLLNYICWREGKGIVYLSMSAALFIVSLLTAEASIALLGYFGAYALTLDRKGWVKGCVGVVPFLLIACIWRISYSMAGYGAANIGLYLDPGRDLLGFAKQLFLVFPCIVTSMVIGVDAVTSSFSLEGRFWIRGLSWLITIGCLYLVKDLLRHDPRVRFMLLGSVLATIPHASLVSADSRSVTFVALGFFFVLALWLKSLWEKRTQGIRFNVGVAVVLGGHLLLPILMNLLASFGTVGVMFNDAKFYGAIKDQIGNQEHSLVVVNHPNPVKMFYLPFEWDYLRRPLPLSVNMLAPGMTSVSLTRESARVFYVSSRGPMAVNQQVDLTAGSDTPIKVHGIFWNQLLQGLITTSDQRYERLVSTSAGNMQITPLEVKDDVPVRVKIEFQGKEFPDEMVWEYFDWKSNEFKSMPVPAIGESVAFPGPFDV